MMPKEVYERWHRMWAANAHTERPWWTKSYPDGEGLVYVAPYWQRCDGLKGPGLLIPGSLLSQELARLDREQPLLRPEPMVGQCWLFPDDHPSHTVQIVGVKGVAPYDARTHHSKGCIEWGDGAERYWPCEGAILVYGPSAYGANVPWMAP